jgi:Cu(I)/Ag(I) efflux system periplasmic protein CusF
MSRQSLTRYRTKLGALLLSLGLLMGASAVYAQTPLADGQVIKIDSAAGKITIKHGPLKQFDMEEGMTMVYRAADPAMLNAVKPGARSNSRPTASTASSPSLRSKKRSEIAATLGARRGPPLFPYGDVGAAGRDY